MSVLVLVVDDEPDVEALFRQHFRRDLRSGRLRMEFAMSAADALAQVARASESSLILILSDINMPGMTGLEMLPKVKALRPEVPVIMITAYGDPETKRRAIEGGADGLLTKPIDFATLRGEIDRRLDGRDEMNAALVARSVTAKAIRAEATAQCAITSDECCASVKLTRSIVISGTAAPVQVFGCRRHRASPCARRAGVQKAPGREVAGSRAAAGQSSAMGISG